MGKCTDVYTQKQLFVLVHAMFAFNNNYAFLDGCDSLTNKY